MTREEFDKTSLHSDIDFEQVIVFKDYCVVCGQSTKKETCSDTCKGIVEKLRYRIKDQIEVERGGVKMYNTQWLKGFNEVQDLIG